MAYKVSPQGKLWGSTEKYEYSCTTANILLCNDTIIVLKITLLHRVSVITIFVVPKRDRQTKKSHFFVYSRRATHDPHDTWHDDRAGPYHFCTPNFLIGSVVSPPRAIENLWENAPSVGKCL